jgi:predicted ribosomally synthesized peptide with nif11-like leader
MSEEQLSALLAKLKEDTSLQEKLKGAADVDAAVAMAQEAGFDVSKADWLRQGETLELSDEELESVAGCNPENFTRCWGGVCMTQQV